MWVIYRALKATWRFQLIEPPELKKMREDRQPFLMAHWHGDELVLLSLIGYYNIATLSSKSKDGEIMNTVIHLMGAKTSRGSSSRGAIEGLLGLIKLLKKGHSCSFAVDGPRGPIYKVKPGLFEISAKLQLPIFISGVSCSSAIRFEKSWNKTFLPRPFSRVVVRWEGPYGPVEQSQNPRDLDLAREYEIRLTKAREEATKLIEPQ